MLIGRIIQLLETLVELAILLLVMQLVKNTSYGNALRTDDIAIINAKEVLENTQDGVIVFYACCIKA